MFDCFIVRRFGISEPVEPGENQPNIVKHWSDAFAETCSTICGQTGSELIDCNLKLTTHTCDDTEVLGDHRIELGLAGGRHKGLRTRVKRSGFVQVSANQVHHCKAVDSMRRARTVGPRFSR